MPLCPHLCVSGCMRVVCVRACACVFFSPSFSFCAGVTVHACAAMHAIVQVSCPVCLNTSSFEHLSLPGNV